MKAIKTRIWKQTLKYEYTSPYSGQYSSNYIAHSVDFPLLTSGIEKNKPGMHNEAYADAVC